MRELSERADALEGRLRHHAEERAIWHKEWDEPHPTERKNRPFASPSSAHPRCLSPVGGSSYERAFLLAIQPSRRSLSQVVRNLLAATLAGMSASVSSPTCL